MRACLGLMLLVACSGAQKKTAPAGEYGETEPASTGDTMVSPETLDLMTRAFKSRRPSISDCYSRAWSAGKIDGEHAAGRITVVATIDTSGKAVKVQVTQNTLNSPDVEACVVKTVQSWALPQPEQTFDFSFSYDFQRG